MRQWSADREEAVVPERVLRVHLLGRIPFEDALLLQRSLVYQVAGDRSQAALVLCEHPPMVTVGRDGSPADLRGPYEPFETRGWPVRWVNRGGGCVLFQPGQVVGYAVVALDALALGIDGYRTRLQNMLCATLADFTIHAESRPDAPGVFVGDRLIAAIGIAVRDWVASYGFTLNIDPDLTAFRSVRNSSIGDGLMTSIERERRGPLRAARVRERIVELFATEFGFDRTSLFFDHPLLHRPPAPKPVALRI
jgi:lipoyl(octanoyl) transferase